MEELKLESKTFRTDPVLLIRCILQYAETLSAPPGHSPENAALPHLTGLSAFFAKKAAAGIRNREKSRLNRSRLYGMMRTLALRMGENLCRQKRLAQPEDIFWLYCEEIEAASFDPAFCPADIIAGRKEE